MSSAPANYNTALKSLLSRDSTPKLGLERMSKLVEALGNPQNKFESIHVAGTNGKGSTCAFLNSLLQQRFEKVGLYTSPHLACARERIQINSGLISEELFVEAERVVAAAADEIGEKPTFFERVTAMAFWAFAEQGVSHAVIEVGLGGRLDGTNIITPATSVITRIDLDHCNFLGDTIEQIAFEKAGIIKRNVPVVTGWQDERALATIRRVARENSSEVIQVTQPSAHELGLRGEHQKHNAALAEAALHAVGIAISAEHTNNALAQTRWPARLEYVQHNVLIDGAHNANGVRALVSFLNKYEPERPIVLVIGTTDGHDCAAMVRELEPIAERIQKIWVTKSRSPRAAAPKPMFKQLANIAPSEIAPHISSALASAAKIAGTEALTVVTGSLYVAGEARGLFIEMPTDSELPIF